MKQRFIQSVHDEASCVFCQDLVVVERDYLKQELGMFLEQVRKLEKENEVLTKEMNEKKEVEEFESLEEEFRKEHVVSISLHGDRKIQSFQLFVI